MLEYNMTKNILLIAFGIFEFLNSFDCSVFFKQIKFNQFKFKISGIVNF